jgi:hypothetical protein
MKLDTESKMQFDNSIGTEERFALRRWFDDLILSQNNHDLESFKKLLSDAFIVQGFTDFPLQKQGFIDLLRPVIFENGLSAVRYPNVSCAFQGYFYHISGDLEIYTDGVLSCEGEAILEVIKNDDDFLLVRQNFSPRMMIAFDL